MSLAQTISERTAPARSSAREYAAAGAGAIAVPVQQRQGGNLLMMIVGYSLLAILVYILIADKPVVGATSGLANLGARTVKAWVEPVDPVAALTGSLGLNGTGSSFPGSTSGGTETGGSVSGRAPSQPPPAPKSIARTPVSKLPGRSGSPATLNLFAQLRQQRIREGVLHA